VQYGDETLLHIDNIYLYAFICRSHPLLDSDTPFNSDLPCLHFHPTHYQLYWTDDNVCAVQLTFLTFHLEPFKFYILKPWQQDILMFKAILNRKCTTQIYC